MYWLVNFTHCRGVEIARIPTGIHLNAQTHTRKQRTSYELALTCNYHRPCFHLGECKTYVLLQALAGLALQYI